MEDLKRWCVLLLSGLTGAAAAVGYAVLTWRGTREASQSLSKSEAEWVRNASTMEVCVIFFSATYFFGRLLARMVRSPQLAAEIRRNGQWHLNILGAMLLIVTAQRFWFTRHGDWRRFDNVFGIACMAVMIALVFVFKLGIGHGKVGKEAVLDERASREKSGPWQP